ncbi:beta-galactosidase [Paractinoplanes bogorensis]|uniref:beta-galactosidase n=1 Tax=Paractinoplanes bogorensis TaxID=1610840 RepID=UPI001FEC3941|nr:beta-galactosidase [Actinoplanes bogorensis]
MISFGGDYNPSRSSLDEDIALMRDSGVTLVTVGVFSWSRVQPAPGRFEFGRLDRVLDALGEGGIGVCLATPTASPPPWFTRAHPGAMPVTADGVRLTHGSRDTYCVNAPAYRAACSSLVGQLAARYGRHPALRLWHVHNEYGTPCYCDHCALGFRAWLVDAYGETALLNDVWSTDFWSQEYASFDEVLPPRATQYLSNPAHVLDYRRFVSDAMLAHYIAQRDLLRPTGVPVTTNFVLGDWVPVDHARWSREVDVVAVDDYPTSPVTHLADRAFTADLARGWATGDPWILMEHAPGAVGPHTLPAGAATAAATTYLSRGATGVMYFQWRATPGGAEQWHSAIVPHEGPETPLFREIADIGRSLAERNPVRVTATRALIYDEQSMWAWQSPHLPTRLDYTAEARRWHRALAATDASPPRAGSPAGSAAPTGGALAGAASVDRAPNGVGPGGAVPAAPLSGAPAETVSGGDGSVVPTGGVLVGAAFVGRAPNGVGPGGAVPAAPLSGAPADTVSGGDGSVAPVVGVLGSAVPERGDSVASVGGGSTGVVLGCADLVAPGGDAPAAVLPERGDHAAPVDVVPLGAPLDDYELVVVPFLHLVSAADHKALRAYVLGGGTLVLTYGSGLTDEHCRVTSGAWEDLIGARVIRRHYDDWREDLELTGATAVLSRAGHPVVTEHHYGQGLVRYVAAPVDDPSRWLNRR